MSKVKKKIFIMSGIFMLLFCVFLYRSKDNIISSARYYKNKVYAAYNKYKNFTDSYKALERFFTHEIKSKSVVIFEPNPYHHECTPGYVKYFIDLGYNVDVLIVEGNEDAFCLFEEKDKLQIFTFKDLTQLSYIYDELLSKFKSYDYSLIQSTDPGKKDLIDKFTSLDNSLFIVHDSGFISDMGLDEINNQNRIFVLGDNKKAVYVNPHYFGGIARKDKNVKTRFFVTSSVFRNYENLVNSAQKLKNENLEFEVVVSGRSSNFNSDSIPESLKDNFIFKHGLSYADMYNEIQNCDYIIINLEPENSEDNYFKDRRCTGSAQLAYGFLKPVIIHQEFAEFYKFSDKNSFIHNGVNLKDVMSKAIKLKNLEYKAKQDELEILSKNIYSISIENLKKSINNKG